MSAAVRLMPRPPKIAGRRIVLMILKTPLVLRKFWRTDEERVKGKFFKKKDRQYGVRLNNPISQ